MPLDPALRSFLDQMAAADTPPPSQQTPQEVRDGYAVLGALGQRPENPPATEDRRLPGPHGEIPVRVYRPDGPGPLPVVVFFHGGGRVIGSIDTHEPLCQQLAVQVPAVVVSVDYRLAPEHPYPAGVEDCMAATRWVAEHAAELGADPTRLAVAGDSAGGNLAAVVCLKARDAGGPPIVFQLLIYPATDLTRSQPSYVENGTGYLLTAEMMEWFVGHYTGGRDLRDPDASPLFAEDLTGLPPALVVTAEFDPLRDEGEAYAERLRAAGGDARAVRYDGMTHAFIQIDQLLPVAQQAVRQAAGALRDAFRPAKV